MEQSPCHGTARCCVSFDASLFRRRADKQYSVTHPFISLISVLKGKRILPRALRHTSPEQTLTLLTLMVATFDTLDTVRDAYMLDASDDSARLSTGSLENNQQRAAVEAKTEVFLNAIISPVMGVIAQAPLRIVTGMLGLMLERNDIIKVARSKVGQSQFFSNFR